MKKLLSSSLLSAFLGVLLQAGAHADQTIAYPSTKDAVFTIQAPDDWKFEPAEDEDSYFTLTNDKDAALYFRTVEGTKETFDAVVDASEEYIAQTYSDVKFDEPKEEKADGVAVISMVGTAKDKEDGSDTLLGIQWVFLKGGRIAEIWYEADAKDVASAKAAAKILGSFDPK